MKVFEHIGVFGSLELNTMTPLGHPVPMLTVQPHFFSNRLVSVVQIDGLEAGWWMTVKISTHVNQGFNQ